jgi:hypothetical protein
MAVITLERTGAAQRVAERLKAMAAAAGAVIDSYVSYRMQTSASEAEYVGRPVTGVAKGACHAQAEHPSSVAIEDETKRALRGIISEVIPVYFVGRNHDGLWVAREAEGSVGGVFLLKDSATSFARRHAGQTGCATIFPSQRFELDLANSGNPLAPSIGWSIRLARRLWRTVAHADKRCADSRSGRYDSGQLARSTERRPSESMLMKTPARAISVGS